MPEYWSLDAVLSCAVLTCMPSEMAQKAAILELKRVLKPGGLFHLSEFCAPWRNVSPQGWVRLCVTTRPRSCRSCWKTLST
ncbi:class I SAM-dependent methyltransferase [Shewanella algae]|uniref:class I SAM-dependent methyltransferase n=1 Tax=Shewanella algae TaxID=38313 RepID=UPI0034D437ED